MISNLLTKISMSSFNIFTSITGHLSRTFLDYKEAKTDNKVILGKLKEKVWNH